MKLYPVVLSLASILGSWYICPANAQITVSPGEVITLKLNVVNVGETKLDGIIVKLDENTLPKWVIPSKRRWDAMTLDGYGAHPAAAKLSLSLRITEDASIGAKEPLKFNVTDQNGDIWDKEVLLTVLPKRLPTTAKLYPNFPNPFNPETWIPYQLPNEAKVTISIFDAAGKLVRVLTPGHQAPGYYLTREKATYWDGRNKTGESVASGIYFYRIQAGKFSFVRKMLLVK